MDETDLTFAAALILGGVALAAPAFGQTPSCAAHDVVTERLADHWGESRQTIALGADGTLLETWANPDTGTWTLTVTAPGGATCLVASGHAFEMVAEAVPPAGEGA